MATGFRLNTSYITYIRNCIYCKGFVCMSGGCFQQSRLLLTSRRPQMPKSIQNCAEVRRLQEVNGVEGSPENTLEGETVDGGATSLEGETVDGGDSSLQGETADGAVTSPEGESVEGRALMVETAAWRVRPLMAEPAACRVRQQVVSL